MKFTLMSGCSLDGFAKIGDTFCNCRPFYGPVAGSGNRGFRNKRLAVADARKRPSTSISGTWILKRLTNGQGWRLVDFIEPDIFVNIDD